MISVLVVSLYSSLCPLLFALVACYLLPTSLPTETVLMGCFCLILVTQGVVIWNQRPKDQGTALDIVAWLTVIFVAWSASLASASLIFLFL